MAMRLKNTNPLGEVYLALIGRTLAPGDEFDIDDERGEALLEQVGNYELVTPTTPPSKATKKVEA